MGKKFNYLINSAYIFSLRKTYKKFISFANPMDIQRKILFDTMEKNKDTEYGIKFCFKNIKSIEDFQRFVPITSYEDYEPYIEKIMNGFQNILTKERVLLMEPTSGSSSAKKLIPYTESLKKQFQQGINPWLYDLYNNHKGLKYGKSYWSISPASSKKEYTKGGIPVGFEEDGAYLGGITKHLMNFIFAVPQEVSKEKEMDDFYLKTSVYLLKCRDLSLISVWHPSFLLLILEFMEKNIDKLPLSEEEKIYLENKEYNKLWSDLKLISCWTSGNSWDFCQEVKKIFPKTTVQGKGLISTEAFSSFPMVEADGSVLSVYSHFFEFKNLKDENIYLCDALKTGEEYEIIVTTGGGFYRYNTKDIVLIKGYYKNLPLMEFVGKNDLISDKFGEKLNELFVKKALKEFGLKDEFAVMAFEENSYVLYTDSSLDFDRFEEKLKESFHYDYAIKLGQLKNLRIFKLNGEPYKEYIEYCLHRGQKLGDIKINKLIKTGGLDKFFKGDYR